ncbi:hypothetical protein JGS22_007995 [Streptomyces sp. P38-E01]|uniref:Elp3/MiaA/NifB-like radical SAM core domain-containing protein n=1 Tax=Streptomyces tardus TaxID=2780544 RepID=A0A949JJX4_9ACTN|nr:radical SAM protein [Streptomyces tardus]MBU7597564.1 hypothetical protein [Streptomyces tardus]
MTDVLLVMPPVSEAVQFPYLALPQLTAAWRAQGYTVRCVDLNLEYRDAVLRRDADPDRPDAGPVDPGAGPAGSADLPRAAEPAAPEPAAEAAAPVPAAAVPTAPVPAAGSGGTGPGAGDVYRQVSERYRSHHGERLLDRSRDRSAPEVQAMAIRATGRYVALRAAADGWLVKDPLPLGELEERVRTSLHHWSARWCGRRLRELIDEHRPKVLAFTVPFFSQVVPVLSLAVRLKEQGVAVPVMVGGPTVQMWAKLLRSRLPAAAAVDHWCTGHGEAYLARVMPPDADRPVDEVPTAPGGLADGFRINDQQAPEFRQFDLLRYANEAWQFPYRLTLGCYWGKCSFCSYGNRYHDDRAFQQLAPGRAADQLVALAGELGITDVAIADENTGLRHLVRVMEEVSLRGVDLTFRVRARLEPALADPLFARTLRELGCVQISTGFESSHQELLDFVRKGQDPVAAEQAVANLTAAGITTNLSFMDGYDHPAAAEGFLATSGTIRRNAATMGLDTMQLLVAEPGSHLWASRWVAPDDEFLVTNEGLAFAAGRIGAALGSPAEAEEARERLLRMTVEAVPDAERRARPDLAPASAFPASASSSPAGGPDRPVPTDSDEPLRAWPRAGVALETVRRRRVLADIAWPRMAAVPQAVVCTDDGALEAVGPRERNWLNRMLHKRLLVTDRKEAEVF